MAMWLVAFGSGQIPGEYASCQQAAGCASPAEVGGNHESLKSMRTSSVNREHTEPVLRQCSISDPQSVEAANVGYSKYMVILQP